MKTARQSLVPVPSDAACGKAMLDCTDAQRAFVLAMVETGGRSQTECAMIAGIGGNRESAAVWASRAMRNERVLAALREETDKAFRGDVLIARSRLRDILEKPQHVDHFRAIKETLDRGGMAIATLHKVEVEHINDGRSAREIMSDLVAQIVANGGDPKVLLGKEVIDAEFSEVPSEDDLSDLYG
jgi:hypothetical protein